MRLSGVMRQEAQLKALDALRAKQEMNTLKETVKLLAEKANLEARENPTKETQTDVIE